MCDYSLHAVATRPAQVGETLVTTTFRGTSTRGFASESDLSVAVCMLPGTELAFAEDVRYEFPDGSYVLVTQLVEGQRATVLQLPVTKPVSAPAHTAAPAPTSSLPVN